MDPEQQHELYLKEDVFNRTKSAIGMAIVCFTAEREDGLEALEFEVQMQIWHDNDWEHDWFYDYVKNIVDEQIDINIDSLKTIADNLFKTMGFEAPGREIQITIKTRKNGITIRYN